MAKREKITILFSPDMDLSSMNKELSSLQSMLKGLTIPSTLTDDLTRGIQNLKFELSSIESLSGTMIDKAGVDSVQKSLLRIAQTYSDISDKVNSINIASAVEPGFAAAKEMNELSAAINNINSDIDRLSNNIKSNLVSAFENVKLRASTSLNDIMNNAFSGGTGGEPLAINTDKIASEIESINSKITSQQQLLLNTESRLTEQARARWELLDSIAQSELTAQEKTLEIERQRRAGNLTNASINDYERQVTLQEHITDAVQKREQALRSTISNLENESRIYQEILQSNELITDAQNESKSLVDNRNQMQTQLMEAQSRSGQELAQSLSQVTTQNNAFGRSAIETSSNLTSMYTATEQAENRAQALRDTFGGITSQLAQVTSGIYLFNKAMNALRSGVGIIQELDRGFTEIAVVTGQMPQDVWARFGEFNDLAKEYAVSTREIVDGSVLFYQQGLKTNEVLQMTEASTIAAALGGVKMADAANTLTAAVNGYNKSAEEALDITDKISAVGAYSAADFNELSVSMEKVSAAAYSAGIDMDHLLGYLGRMIEATREAPENLGTALNTIIARFQQLSVDPAALLEDGTAANDVEEALSSVGIALRTVNGDFRDLQDVIDELGGKWSELDRNQQAYIATTVAGARQQSRFRALMNDYDRTLELVRISQNSNGEALQQYESYLGGLEAAQNRLTVSTEALAQRFINSDFLIGAIDGLSGVVELVSELPAGFTAAGVALTAFTLKLKSLNSKSTIQSIGNAMGQGIDVGGQGFTQNEGFFGQITAKLTSGLDKAGRAMGKISAEADLYQAKLNVTASSILPKITGELDNAYKISLNQVGAEQTIQGILNNTIKTTSDLTQQQRAAQAESLANAYSTVVAEEQANIARARGVALATAANIALNVGLALLGVGIVKAVEAINNHFSRYRDNIEEANRALSEQNRVTNKLEQNVARYEQLATIVNLTAAEEEELANIISDLADQYPQLISYIDSEGNAHLKNAEAIREELEIQRQLLRERRIASAQATFDLYENPQLANPFTGRGKVTFSTEEAEDSFRKLEQTAGETFANIAAQASLFDNSMLEGGLGFGEFAFTDNIATNSTEEIVSQMDAVIVAMYEKKDELIEAGTLTEQDFKNNVSILESTRTSYVNALNQGSGDIAEAARQMASVTTEQFIDELEAGGLDVSQAQREFLDTVNASFVGSTLDIGNFLDVSGRINIEAFTNEAKNIGSQLRVAFDGINFEEIVNSGLIESINQAIGDGASVDSIRQTIATFAQTIGIESQEAMDLITSAFLSDDRIADTQSRLTRALQNMFPDEGVSSQVISRWQSFFDGMDSTIANSMTEILDAIGNPQLQMRFLNALENGVFNIDAYQQLTNDFLEGFINADQFNERLNSIFANIGFTPEESSEIINSLIPSTDGQEVNDKFEGLYSQLADGFSGLREQLKQLYAGGLDGATLQELMTIDPSISADVIFNDDGTFDLMAGGYQKVIDAQRRTMEASIQLTQELREEQRVELSLSQTKLESARATERDLRQKIESAQASGANAEEIERLTIAYENATNAISSATDEVQNWETQIDGSTNLIVQAQEQLNNLDFGPDRILATIDAINELASQAELVGTAMGEISKSGEVQLDTMYALIDANSAYAEAFQVNAQGQIETNEVLLRQILENEKIKAQATTEGMALVQEASALEARARAQAAEQQIAVEQRKAQLTLGLLDDILAGNELNSEAITEINKLNGTNFATIEQGKVSVSETAMQSILDGERDMFSHLTADSAGALSDSAKHWSSYADDAIKNIEAIATEWNKLQADIAANAQTTAGSGSGAGVSGDYSAETISTEALRVSTTDLLAVQEEFNRNAAADARASAAYRANIENRKAEVQRNTDAAIGALQSYADGQRAIEGEFLNTAESIRGLGERANAEVEKAIQEGFDNATKTSSKKGSKEKAQKEAAAFKLIEDAAKNLENALKKAAQANENFWSKTESIMDNTLSKLSLFKDQLEEFSFEFDKFYNYRRKLDQIDTERGWLESLSSNPLLSGDEYLEFFRAQIGASIGSASISRDFIGQLRNELEIQAAALRELYGAYYNFDEYGQIYQNNDRLEAEIESTINELRQNVLNAGQALNDAQNQLTLKELQQSTQQEVVDYYKTIQDTWTSEADSLQKTIENQEKKIAEAVQKNLDAQAKYNEALAKGEDVSGMNPEAVSWADLGVAQDELASLRSELEAMRQKAKEAGDEWSSQSNTLKDYNNSVKEAQKNIQDLQLQYEREQMVLKQTEQYVDDMTDAVQKYEQAYADLQDQITRFIEELQRLVEYRELALNTTISIQQQLYDSLVEEMRRETDAIKKEYDERINLDKQYLDRVKKIIAEERAERDRNKTANELYRGEKYAELLSRDTSGAYENERMQQMQKNEDLREQLQDKLTDHRISLLEKEIALREELLNREKEALDDRLEYYTQNSDLLWQEVNRIFLQGADAVQAQLETTQAYITAGEYERQKMREQWEQQIALALESTVNHLIVDLDRMIEEYQRIMMTEIPEIQRALDMYQQVFNNSTYSLESEMNRFANEFRNLVQMLGDEGGAGIRDAANRIRQAAEEWYQSMKSQQASLEAQAQQQQQLVIQGSKIEEGTEEQEIKEQYRIKNIVTGKTGTVTTADILEWLRRNPNWKQYAEGGLVNYTGPAWVDGSPSSPEAFLSAVDTKLIQNLVDNLRNGTELSPYQSNIDPREVAEQADLNQWSFVIQSMVFNGVDVNNEASLKKAIESQVKEVLVSTTKNRPFMK